MNSIRILKDEGCKILTDNETALEFEYKTTKVKLKINKGGYNRRSLAKLVDEYNWWVTHCL